MKSHGGHTSVGRSVSRDECSCPYPDPKPEDAHRGCPIHGDDYGERWEACFNCEPYQSLLEQLNAERNLRERLVTNQSGEIDRLRAIGYELLWLWRSAARWSSASVAPVMEELKEALDV